MVLVCRLKDNGLFITFSQIWEFGVQDSCKTWNSAGKSRTAQENQGFRKKIKDSAGKSRTVVFWGLFRGNCIPQAKSVENRLHIDRRRSWKALLVSKAQFSDWAHDLP